MTKKILTVLTALLSFTLSLSVLMHGVHAKELTSFSRNTSSNTKMNEVQMRKTTTDDGGIVKIHAEPHNHVDHQTSKSIVKVFGDTTNMNADARNLRKVRHARRHDDTHVLDFLFGLLPLKA